MGSPVDHYFMIIVEPTGSRRFHYYLYNVRRENPTPSEAN